MPDFRASVIIQKPIEDVFNFASDADNAQDIMPYVIKREKVTDGPLRKGSKFTETRVVRRKKVTSEIELTEYEPYTTFTTKSDSNGVVVEYQYKFYTIEEGTQVEFDANIHLSGGLGFLTKFMLVKIIKKEDGDQLKNLKRLMETEEQKNVEKESN